MRTVDYENPTFVEPLTGAGMLNLPVKPEPVRSELLTPAESTVLEMRDDREVVDRADRGGGLIEAELES